MSQRKISTNGSKLNANMKYKIIDTLVFFFLFFFPKLLKFNSRFYHKFGIELKSGLAHSRTLVSL